MDMDALASPFSRLPYFTPNMIINRSEMCATRRLTQCTDFGISMNDVTPKFCSMDAVDLEPHEFRARQIIIDQMELWSERNAQGQTPAEFWNKWTPILYSYEIVKTAAKTERDWGHMLFTDATLSHFMLIMIYPNACNCGNLSHDDYDALTRYHADRMMSLLIYLHEEWGWGNKPGWVRATYVTPKEGYKASSDFLDSWIQKPGENRKDGRPPFYIVTPGNFKPTLLPSELEKIDNTVAGSSIRTRQAAGSRTTVLGQRGSRPEVSRALKGKNQRQCAHCEELKELEQLSRCSRCKLTWYCGPEWRVVWRPVSVFKTLTSDCSQRKAWPRHKASCRKAGDTRAPVQSTQGAPTVRTEVEDTQTSKQKVYDPPEELGQAETTPKPSERDRFLRAITEWLILLALAVVLARKFGYI